MKAELLENNDIVDAINMINTISLDQHYGYYRNPACWIAWFLKCITKPADFIVLKAVDQDKMIGFMVISAYTSHYNGEKIADVKEVIIDTTAPLALRAIATKVLVEEMISHMKRLGLNKWRIDTIRPFDESLRFANFLKKRFNGVPYVSIRGEIK